MKLTTGRVLALAAVIALLIVPEIALTQGPGTQGRVLNVRLRTVYATVTAALADPNLQAGDRLLIAGLIDESANNGIDFSGIPNITIVSESRPAFVARIDTGGACLTTATNLVDTVVDLSGRTGTVTWIGGIINVPDGCFAFFSDTGPGTGITIQGVTIQGAAGDVIGGIGTQDEPGGPFRFLSNRITGDIGAGIVLDGNGVGNINATIRGNRITVTGDGAGTANCAGIILQDTLSATTILVERNRVDGGGSTLSCGVGLGIAVGNGEDVTVQRNTVQNFSSGIFASGILINNTSTVVVRSNVIRNNDIGVLVDPFVCSASPFPLVNNNNITGSTTLALGFGCGTYDLDARNNFWGAGTGPADAEGDAACGSPTPPTAANCNTAAGAGGDIDALAKPGGTSDCCGGGGPACNGTGFVQTCPFKLFAIFGIGA